MSNKKITTDTLEEALPVVTIEEPEVDPVEKIQSFFQLYGKKIAIVAGALVLGFAGVYCYGEFITKPKEEKAAEAIYKAQYYFSVDSSKLVLDGDGTSKGVLYIISNYGGTKAANLAHFYAGVSYLKQGNFAKAIEHLKDFKTDAKQVQLVANGCLGDAYAESGNKEAALEAYINAAHTFEKDESSSAEYLQRAALLYETMDKGDKALELYKEIKEKFPRTEKGNQVDKYINRLSVEKTNL